MAAYTRLSESDIGEILKFYKVPALKKVEPLSLGISNSNYRCELENDQAILLKVSNDKEKEDLKEEQRILAVLDEYAYSLVPLKTKRNETVYEWKSLNGVVFPFVPGEKPMGNFEEIQQLGKALGVLHVFSRSKGLELKDIRSHSQVGYELEGVLSYCEESSSLDEFAQTCHALLRPQEIKLWRDSELPRGLIHGDLYLDNTLFVGGELKTLLDFEQAGLGCFIQDIGISISGSCLDRDGVSFEKINAFVAGYEEARPLEPQEKTLLNFSVMLGFLDISLWRIKRFYNGNLDPQKKHSYKELLELARDFKSKI